MKWKKWKWTLGVLAVIGIIAGGRYLYKEEKQKIYNNKHISVKIKRMDEINVVLDSITMEIGLLRKSKNRISPVVDAKVVELIEMFDLHSIEFDELQNQVTHDLTIS